MNPTNRSERVHIAQQEVPCRYELCRKAAKATRAFHTLDRRIQDTLNEALERLGGRG